MNHSESMMEGENEANLNRCKKDVKFVPKVEASSTCDKTSLKSFYGVNPHCHFGPKAKILKQPSSFLQIPDPASQKLQWRKPPTSVLVIIKMFDCDIITPFCELISWLLKEMNLTVYVEARVMQDPQLNLTTMAELANYRDHIHTIGIDDDITNKVDLIICMGGDGTLLHASSLFQRSVPPVMAFHFGSLGFLEPFDFTNFRHEITEVLSANVNLTLRSRLKCIVKKSSSRSTTSEYRVGDIQPTVLIGGRNEVKADNKRDVTTTRILVLNEVVIERGHSSFLTYLDLYIGRKLVTSVQGDGLIIATPTGSTAYSLAAGASMVHPSVPCIVITPICPHSLSFRPIIIPAGVDVQVMVSQESRNSAWASFDGRNRQEIHNGDSINLTTAAYPVPHVRKKDRIDDWFDSLAECLHWNVRKPQRRLSSVSLISKPSHEDSEHGERSLDNGTQSDDSSMLSFGEADPETDGD